MEEEELGKGDCRHHHQGARQNLNKTLFLFISDSFASDEEEKEDEGEEDTHNYSDKRYECEACSQICLNLLRKSIEIGEGANQDDESGRQL